MDIDDALRRGGGIASTADLRRTGLDSSALRRAAAAGRLTRIRMGWYAASWCPPAVVSAVRAGGTLSCVSALALRGAWTLDDEHVHVRVGRGATVRGGPGLQIHWDPGHLTSSAIDPPLEALRLAVACLDLRHAVAVADSALHLGLVSESEVGRLDSPRGRRVTALADAKAESGLETFARLGLRSLKVRVRSQVTIPTVGRVDFLIGDRLVFEVDGAAWHGGIADFERDRERDRRLAELGYLVIRATYRQVIEGWPTVRDHILALVRRREHLWRHRDPGRTASWS
jgi:very-short-patch-repair endonuclease